MSVAVIDAGIAIGWMQGRHRSLPRLDRLFRAGRGGRTDVVLSVVNLAEVLLHTTELTRATGIDAVALLTASRVRIHQPDEAIARRVAKLRTSLADGFAAATAQELGARLHTTDGELIRMLRGTRLPAHAVLKRLRQPAVRSDHRGLVPCLRQASRQAAPRTCWALGTITVRR